MYIDPSNKSAPLIDNADKIDQSPTNEVDQTDSPSSASSDRRVDLGDSKLEIRQVSPSQINAASSDANIAPRSSCAHQTAVCLLSGIVCVGYGSFQVCKKAPDLVLGLTAMVVALTVPFKGNEMVFMGGFLLTAEGVGRLCCGNRSARNAQPVAGENDPEAPQENQANQGNNASQQNSPNPGANPVVQDQNSNEIISNAISV